MRISTFLGPDLIRSLPLPLPPGPRTLTIRRSSEAQPQSTHSHAAQLNTAHERLAIVAHDAQRRQAHLHCLAASWLCHSTQQGCSGRVRKGASSGRMRHGSMPLVTASAPVCTQDRPARASLSRPQWWRHKDDAVPAHEQVRDDPLVGLRERSAASAGGWSRTSPGHDIVFDYIHSCGLMQRFTVFQEHLDG